MRKSIKVIFIFLLAISLVFSNIIVASAIGNENIQNEITNDDNDDIISENDGIDIEEVEGEVNYVAIEQSYLKTPDTQKIVVSFGEAHQVDDAKLILQSNGKTMNVSLKEQQDNLYLFEKKFDENEKGIYTVVSFRYIQDGKIKLISLNKENICPKFGVDEKYDDYVDETPIVNEDDIDNDESMIICQSTNVDDTSEQIKSSLEELQLTKKRTTRKILSLYWIQDMIHHT